MTEAESPLAGLFRHPCGAWVCLYRFRSGAGWFKPLVGATRATVLHGAYGMVDKSEIN